MSVTPPWADTPTCKKCKVAAMLAHVPPEDDHEPDDDEDGSGCCPSEELAALNDCDASEWLWCPKCCEVIHVGAKAHRQAVKADEWWERPDREQAWAEFLREREIDRVAAEHAARQLDMFGGGS